MHCYDLLVYFVSASIIDQQRAFALLVILNESNTSRAQKRKFWTSSWHNTSFNPTTELAFTEDDFKGYLRMDSFVFGEILHAISPCITKNDTIMRKSISAEKRLSITLRFLATGESFASLHYQYRIGCSTVASIIHDTVYCLLQVFPNQIKVCIL